MDPLLTEALDQGKNFMDYPSSPTIDAINKIIQHLISVT